MIRIGDLKEIEDGAGVVETLREKGISKDTAYLFDTLHEIRVAAKIWIDDYNYDRPHIFLGKLSTIEYLKKYNLEQNYSA